MPETRDPLQTLARNLYAEIHHRTSDSKGYEVYRTCEDLLNLILAALRQAHALQREAHAQMISDLQQIIRLNASLVQEMETLIADWREQAENMRLRRGQTTGPMSPHRYIENCASAVEALLRRSPAPGTETP